MLCTLGRIIRIPFKLKWQKKIYLYIQLFRVNDSCLDAIIIAKILSSASPESIVINLTYLDNLHVLRLSLTSTQRTISVILYTDSN